MSKEEKELKKDLMQKDKETLVELYLQKNFDANILIQQLKAEFEKRNKKIIKDNQILGNEIKRKEVLITDLKIESERLKEENKDKDTELHGAFVSNDKLSAKISNLKQQLAEKDAEIEKYKQQINEWCGTKMAKLVDKKVKENTHQVCEKIRKEIYDIKVPIEYSKTLTIAENNFINGHRHGTTSCLRILDQLENNAEGEK